MQDMQENSWVKAMLGFFKAIRQDSLKSLLILKPDYHSHYYGVIFNTLHERMFPKAENVSYRALLSMDLSRFLMKMFPTPLFLSDGSRCDHMIRTGLPLITSKFMVSRARSAEGGSQERSPKTSGISHTASRAEVIWPKCVRWRVVMQENWT